MILSCLSFFKHNHPADSQLVIGALHNLPIQSDWEIQTPIADAQHLLASFNSWEAIKIHGVANRCGHSLTKRTVVWILRKKEKKKGSGLAAVHLMLSIEHDKDIQYRSYICSSVFG